MTAIMKSAPGQLLVVRSSSETPPTSGLLTIEGLNGGGQDVVISNFQAASKVAAQIQPTVGGPHYIYSFGRELMDIQLTVVAYPRTCEGEAAGSGNGLKKAWSFFEAKSLSPTNSRPIKLTFSGMTLYAFVMAMDTRVEASAGFPVSVITFHLKGWIDATTVEGSTAAVQAATEALRISDVNRTRENTDIAERNTRLLEAQRSARVIEQADTALVESARVNLAAAVALGQSIEVWRGRLVSLQSNAAARAATPDKRVGG